MTEEQAISKFRNLPPIAYLIHGYYFDDGDVKWECVAVHSRDEAAREAKNFLKFKLYRVEEDKNQNL